MRKAAVVLSGMIIGLVLFLSSAQAADKFAYIDLSRTFSEYNKTKGYDKTLSDKEKNYTDERDKKVADLKAFQDKLSLLNDKEREAKGAELQAKVKDFQDYDRQKQADLKKPTGYSGLFLNGRLLKSWPGGFRGNLLGLLRKI